MRFVFLGPEVRLQLPSDTSSRWLPLLFGSEFPSSRPPEDSHLQVTSRFGFPRRFPSYVHHARSFAPCPAHVGAAYMPPLHVDVPIRDYLGNTPCSTIQASNESSPRRLRFSLSYGQRPGFSTMYCRIRLRASGPRTMCSQNPLCHTGSLPTNPFVLAARVTAALKGPTIAPSEPARSSPGFRFDSEGSVFESMAIKA